MLIVALLTNEPVALSKLVDFDHQLELGVRCVHVTYNHRL